MKLKFPKCDVYGVTSKKIAKFQVGKTSAKVIKDWVHSIEASNDAVELRETKLHEGIYP